MQQAHTRLGENPNLAFLRFASNEGDADKSPFGLEPVEERMEQAHIQIVCQATLTHPESNPALVDVDPGKIFRLSSSPSEHASRGININAKNLPGRFKNF